MYIISFNEEKLNKLIYYIYKIYLIICIQLRSLFINNTKSCILKNFLILVLFIIDSYLYNSSIAPCLDDEITCLLKIKMYISQGFKVLYASIILAIILFLIYQKIVHKFHLFYILITYFIFYLKDHQENLRYHGLINFSSLISFTIIFYMLLIILSKLYSLIISKKYKHIKIVLFTSFIIIHMVKNNYDKITRCDKWDIGLNNTKINNKGAQFGCKIKKPKKCQLNYFNYFRYFSYQYIQNSIISCKNRKREEKLSLRNHNKYVTDKTKRIGFMVTANNPKFNMSKIDSFGKLNQIFLDNLIDMDNEEQLNNIPEQFKPEVIINYNKNIYGEIEINLRFNSSLSKERKKKQNKNSIYKNILFLYVDALSRPQFIQKLPKTSKFLSKFMKYNGNAFEYNGKKNVYHAFEFFKYHSMIRCTVGNELPMIYGRRFDENKANDINKYFQENGYITGITNEQCAKDSTPLGWGRLHGNEIPRYGQYHDHELFVLACDPFHGIVWRKRKGMNSSYKRCLYGKMFLEHQIEYAKQFFEKYKNNQKYFRLIVQDAHDSGTNHLISFDDDIFYEFLIYIFKNFLLNDGALLFLSDHGNASNEMFYLFEDYVKERLLPFLYIILQDDKKKTYNQQYKYIIKNQQTFIYAYDIYNTLSNIIYGNEYYNIKNKTKYFDSPKSKRGKSLLEYINPIRDCKNLQDIGKNCMCNL